MRLETESRAREILARLRELRDEEDRLQTELFEITEANGWYSSAQQEEVRRHGVAR